MLVAVYVGDYSLGHYQILSLNTRGPLPVAENVYHYATAIFNDVFRFRLILCGNYGALNLLTVQGAKSDAPLWELTTNRIVCLWDAAELI